MPDHHDDDALVAQILCWISESGESGNPATLKSLLDRFPNREDLVRQVWNDIHDLRETTAPDHNETDGWRGDCLTSIDRHLDPSSRYRLIGRIGAGGQGEVHLAEDRHLGRKVALKLLRKIGSLDGDALRRFRREAEVASRVDHPGVCAVYDSGIVDGVPFIAMRYVEGRTLAALIATSAHPDSRVDGTTATRDERSGTFRAARIIEAAARAVHAAHEAGVLHRDLKPANIMITAEDEPVILDFGIARSTGNDETLQTRTGDVFGTPAYLPPEALRATRTTPDRTTDVYGLGVTLYEFVTGRRPFDAPTREGLYRAILEDEPVDPGHWNRAISKDLRIVILTAMDKDRDRRYQSALALAEDLRRLRDHEPILARPAGPLLRLGRWIRRDRMRAALCVLILVVAGVAGYATAWWPAFRAEMDDARRRSDMALLEESVEEGFDEIADLDPKAAIVAFDRALAQTPGHVAAITGKAWALIQDDRQEEALRWLDGYRALEPTESSLTWVRQEALRGLGRIDEAIQIVRRLGTPQTPFEIYISAYDHLKWAEVGDKDAARQGLSLMKQCVLLSHTNRALYVYHLSWASGVARDEAECRRTAAVLKSRWGDKARAWYWVANALDDWDPQESLVACEKSIALEPGQEPAVIQKAVTLQKLGNVEEARRLLESALERNPESGQLLARLGILLHESRQDDQSLAMLQRAVAAAPKLANVHNALGAAHLRKKDFPAAAAAFRAALEIVPRFASAWSNLGLALYNTGDTKGSREAAERSLSIDPSLAEPHCVLGMGHEREGEFVKAVKALRAATAARPDYVQAKMHLATGLFGLRRYREAQAEIESVAEAVARLNLQVEIPRRFVEEIEAMATLEGRLESVVDGREFPLDMAETVALVTLARRLDRPAVAAELFEHAVERRLEGSAEGWFEAAKAAALAAGVDPTGDPRRAAASDHWRERALFWLDEGMTALERDVALEKLPKKRALSALEACIDAPELGSIREHAATLPLPSKTKERIKGVWARLREAANTWIE